MSFQNEVKSWLSPRRFGGQFALAFVIVSVAAHISDALSSQVVLTPYLVVHELKLWQVLTWLFIVPADPLFFLFGIMISLQTGSFLEDRLGYRRLWLLVIANGVVTGVLVTLAGLVSSRIALGGYSGGWLMLGCMWVAQGLLVGNGRLNFWFLPISGYAFALIGVLFVMWPLLRGAWVPVVPGAIGLGLTFAWFLGINPGALWTRFRSWQLSRQLRGRSGHLKVVAGEKRNTRSDSDRYLH